MIDNNDRSLKAGIEGLVLLAALSVMGYISVLWHLHTPPENMLYYSKLFEYSWQDLVGTKKVLGLFFLWSSGPNYALGLWLTSFAALFIVLKTPHIKYYAAFSSLIIGGLLFDDASYLWSLTGIPPQALAIAFFVRFWATSNYAWLILSFLCHPLFAITSGVFYLVSRFFKAKYLLHAIGIATLTIMLLPLVEGMFPRETKAILDYANPAHSTYSIGKIHATVIFFFGLIDKILRLRLNVAEEVFPGFFPFCCLSAIGFFYSGIIPYREFFMLSFVFFASILTMFYISKDFKIKYRNVKKIQGYK